MNDVIQAIQKHKIVVIYRGYSPDECIALTEALFEAGIRLFEVTMNSENALESITQLSKQFPGASIGAGTVLTPKDVDQAADAGAAYMISPNLNLDVVKRTKDKGLISIPGTFTPTEIQAAAEAGADIIKVFPINAVGANYIKQVKAPLDNVLLMPCGGIRLAFAKELFEEGANAIGVGVHIFGKNEISSKDWNGLKANVKPYLDLVNHN